MFRVLQKTLNVYKCLPCSLKDEDILDTYTDRTHA